MSAPGIGRAVGAKAAGDLSVSDMNTNGGLMLEAQAREFVEEIKLAPTILSLVDVKVMAAQKERIEYAGFNGRISHPDVPGVESTEAQRSKLTTSKQTLDAQDFRAVVDLNYKVQNENIMRWGLAGFVQKEMARQVAIDIQDNVFNGDTESEDDDLAPFDGIIKQALPANTIDYTSTPVVVNDWPFFLMWQTMPEDFLQDVDNLVYLCSPKTEAAYDMYLKITPNAMGTRYESQNMIDRLQFKGAAIRRFAKCPDDTIILTHKWNIRVGFWVQMYLESQRFIDPGIDKFVMRYSCDVKYVHPSGAVVFQGLENSVYPSAAAA